MFTLYSLCKEEPDGLIFDGIYLYIHICHEDYCFWIISINLYRTFRLGSFSLKTNNCTIYRKQKYELYKLQYWNKLVDCERLRVQYPKVKSLYVLVLAYIFYHGVESHYVLVTDAPWLRKEYFSFIYINAIISFKECEI